MKARKILVSLAALALVAAISIGGTLAYLTAQSTVKNTFTVGKIGMTMDEALVNEDGEPVTRNADGSLTVVENPGAATRVNENSYKIMPGHTYTKDPTIYVAAKSEASYVFIAVKNDVAAYEAETVSGGYTRIDAQIANNEWTAVGNAITAPAGYTIYYKTQAATGNAAETLSIFSNFKIADNAERVAGYADFAGNVNIFAFAVQRDGFTGYAEAWAKAGFGAKLNDLIG